MGLHLSTQKFVENLLWDFFIRLSMLGNQSISLTINLRMLKFFQSEWYFDCIYFYFISFFFCTEVQFIASLHVNKTYNIYQSTLHYLLFSWSYLNFLSARRNLFYKLFTHVPFRFEHFLIFLNTSAPLCFATYGNV